MAQQHQAAQKISLLIFVAIPLGERLAAVEIPAHKA